MRKVIDRAAKEASLVKEYLFKYGDIALANSWEWVKVPKWRNGSEHIIFMFFPPDSWEESKFAIKMLSSIENGVERQIPSSIGRTLENHGLLGEKTKLV